MTEVHNKIVGYHDDDGGGDDYGDDNDNKLGSVQFKIIAIIVIIQLNYYSSCQRREAHNC